MTEPDQRDKDPEPAGKWVNAVTMMEIHPDRTPKQEGALEEGWEEELEGQPEGMPHGGPARGPEEARAGTEDRINCLEYMK